MIQVFKERNKNNFSPELLNKISMKDLFKGNMATFLNANESKLDTLPPFSRIPPLSSQMMPPQLYDANNLSKLMSNQIYPLMRLSNITTSVPNSFTNINAIGLTEDIHLYLSIWQSSRRKI